MLYQHLKKRRRVLLHGGTDRSTNVFQGLSEDDQSHSPTTSSSNRSDTGSISSSDVEDSEQESSDYHSTQSEPSGCGTKPNNQSKRFSDAVFVTDTSTDHRGALPRTKPYRGPGGQKPLQPNTPTSGLNHCGSSRRLSPRRPDGRTPPCPPSPPRQEGVPAADAQRPRHHPAHDASSTPADSG